MAEEKMNTPETPDSSLIAPPGKTWQCQACGKTSVHQYGDRVEGRKPPSYGWDESCVLNCMLIDEK